MCKSPMRGKFTAQNFMEINTLMRIIVTILLCTFLIITGCAGKKGVQNIDYELEFEKGKKALSKKIDLKSKLKNNKISKKIEKSADPNSPFAVLEKLL